MAKALKGTELIPTQQFGLPIEQLGLSDSQMQVFAISEKRLAASTAMISRLEKDGRAVKARIEASDDAKKLKEIKHQLRVMKQIETEASSAYNGAIELALCEIKGNSLQEKIRNIQSGNSNKQLTS